MPRRAVVTGAFSYLGAAVAREMRRREFTVDTLTRRRPPAGSTEIAATPLEFDPDHLIRALRGADVLVNTYWIRLPHRGLGFETAVENSRILVETAATAKVGRLVHVSVTNASLDSPLGYYRGKAEVDAVVRGSGVSHAIVRPTLIVGPQDVLTSNIAWFLRRFPLFPVPDGGAYRLQPVTLGDAARIIADAAEAGRDLDVDAAGPETFSFVDYLRLLARACDVRRSLVRVPGWLALAGLGMLSPFLRDTVLTREELDGLERELLVSRAAPLGSDSVRGWLLEHGAMLGRVYVNDRRRHFGRGAQDPVEAR
jgi:NADH dehydrogenase